MSYRKAVSRVLAAVLIVVVLLGAAGAAYLYYGGLPIPGTLTSTTQGPPQFTSTAQGPAQFTFTLLPPFVHVSPGVCNNVRVDLRRSPGFSAIVTVELLNPPSWIAYRPLTLNSTSTNGTLIVGATPDALKTMATLTVRASSPGSAEQTATLEIKVVGVTKVTTANGTAVVYETTKVLNSETLRALTSYSNDTGIVVFSETTSQLQSLERGDVISAPPRASEILPHGFLLMVLSAQQQGGRVTLQTRQAGILDAVQQLDVKGVISAASSAGLGSQGSLGPASPGSLGPELEWDFGPYNLAPGGNLVAQGHLWTGWNIPWHASIHCGWGCDVNFGVHLRFGQDFQLSLQGTAGSVLDWHQDLDSFNLPITIIPGILWIEIKVLLEAVASGNLNQDVNFYFHEGWGFEVGPDYDDGWSFYQRWDLWPPKVENSGTVSPGSGSNARLALHLGLQGSVSGIAGVHVDGWLFTELDSDWTRPRPRWWVDGGVDANAGVYVDVWVWGESHDFGPWTLLRGRLFEEPGVNAPPVVAITNYKAESTLVLGGIVMPPPFNAIATDPEDGDLCVSTLPKSLVWTVNGVQMGTGCSFPYQFSEGDYQITFTATDSEGGTAFATVLLHVKPKPPNYPPTISILKPDRASGDVNTQIKWTCWASDPEGDSISYQFWLKSGDGPFEIKKKWSWDNYWIWTPTTTGTYTAACWVRDMPPLALPSSQGIHQGPDWADQGVESEPYTIEAPPIIPPTEFRFKVEVSPTTIEVRPGETATYTVTVTSTALLAQPQPVGVQVEGSYPNIVAVSFIYGTPNPVFTGTITIQTAHDTPTGTYVFTVTGTGGGKTAPPVFVTLVVLPPMIK